MIRRGEHPFMNAWALPGGFVKPNESVEQAAYRELKEEAGISDVTLSQLQVFSEPKRDPRGWIVSSSFIAFAEDKDLSLQYGEDAIDAQWFDITYSKLDSSCDESKKNYILDLRNSDASLSAKLEVTTTGKGFNKNVEYNIIDTDGIAFDHAKILAMAVDRIIDNLK
jgi:oxygen-independent coproporphyrinogen-3 oxidase